MSKSNKKKNQAAQNRAKLQEQAAFASESSDIENSLVEELIKEDEGSDGPDNSSLKESQKDFSLKKKEKKSEDEPINIKKEIISWTILIATAVLLAFVITHFVIIKAEVPTSSMENTVMTGDKIIGNRLSYLFSEPERGDIVLFYLPDNEEEIYIKRIIGLPGDTIEIVDGELFINGETYEEDYLKEEMYGSFGPYEVPEGKYFMMGDNRNVSLDARRWKKKFVALEKIIGKAWFKYSPSLEIIQ